MSRAQIREWRPRNQWRVEHNPLMREYFPWKFVGVDERKRKPPPQIPGQMELPFGSKTNA